MLKMIYFGCIANDINHNSIISDRNSTQMLGTRSSSFIPLVKMLRHFLL